MVNEEQILSKNNDIMTPLETAQIAKFLISAVNTIFKFTKKNLQKDRRIAKIFQELDILKLENSFESIYIHALINYGCEKNIDEKGWVELMSLPEVIELFNKHWGSSKITHAERAKNIKTAFCKHNFVDTPTSLVNLHYESPSIEKYQKEIQAFYDIFYNLWIKSNNPSERTIYNFTLETNILITDFYYRYQEDQKQNSYSFQLKEYQLFQVKEWERTLKKIKHYLHIDGKEKELISPLSRNPNNDLEYRIKSENSMDGYVISWLENNRNLLVIVGEYGTGKTTFLKFLMRELAVQFLGMKSVNIIKDYKEKVRFPLYIPLYDYTGGNLIHFIINFCRNEGIDKFNGFKFSQELENGNLILVLDGFDEITKQSSANQKTAHFQKIKKIITDYPNVKIILTTRLEYFQSMKEIENTFESNSQIVYTQYLTKEQTQEYLNETVPLKADEYQRNIHEKYDLNDLAKRPVLLYFIVKYLPSLLKQRKSITKITTSEIYEYVIKEEIKRSQKNHNTIINSELQLKILKEIALWTYQNDESLSFNLKIKKDSKQIRKFIKKIETPKSESAYKAILNEFLKLSLLVPSGEKCFSFSHKSFQDYLISQVLIHEINTEKIAEFGKRKYRNEILDFIKEGNPNQKFLLKLVQTSKNRKKNNKWIETNAVRVIKILSHHRRKIPRDIQFYGCDFYEVGFSSTSFMNTIGFENCKLVDCTFNNEFIKYDLKNTLVLGGDIGLGGNRLIKNLKILDRIKNLRKLWVYNTGVKDFTKIEEILSLEELLINSDFITIIPNISALKKLKMLAIQVTPIEDIQLLRELKALKKLYLNDTKINSIECLSHLKKLEILNIASTNITEISSLSKLEKLIGLSLGNLRIKDLQPISKLIKLVHLDISNTLIQNFDFIKNLKELDELHIRDIKVQDLSPLYSLKKLRILRVSPNQLSDFQKNELKKELLDLTIIEEDKPKP